jgi:RNA polymerase sigma factor (sigma-70 family)
MSFFSNTENDTFWCNLSLKWVYTDLFRSIYGRTHNFHLANDVLHDAIVKFAVKNSLKQIEEPQAYLRGIVKNTLVDYYRDAAHYVDAGLLGADSTNIDPELELSDKYSPEKMVDIKQRMHALQNIIDCLPPKCRQVFWMHRIEGQPQLEIAAELGISLNMVERHMIRALVDIALAKDYLLHE